MEILFKIPSEQKAAFIREIKNALKEELEEIKAANHKEASHDEEYLNRQEACKLLRCSLATLYNYQKAGRLPFLKIGRKVLFKKSELISALQ
jgi:excisionase family DNA binding protein